MKIRLVCTATGLRPETDEDYEKKCRLKRGETYVASIVHVRNPRFHRKYFSLINCAWEYLGERAQEGFRNSKESFRKTVEVAAGYYEPMWSVSRREWVQVPKSISFDQMGEEEFSRLYEGVKDVLFEIFLQNVNRQDFMTQLINY